LFITLYPLELESKLEPPKLKSPEPEPPKNGRIRNTAPFPTPFSVLYFCCAVFRIRIRIDPHNQRPHGSGLAWADADPDPGGNDRQNKTKKCLEAYDKQ